MSWGSTPCCPNKTYGQSPVEGHWCFEYEKNRECQALWQGRRRDVYVRMFSMDIGWSLGSWTDLQLSSAEDEWLTD